MKTIFYLAMTAQEIASCPRLPENYGYMACHFSPHGPGLTDLPAETDNETMLILNDRIPFHGHDCRLIARELASLPCSAILLDFQQTSPVVASPLIQALLSSCKMPVAVPEQYAEDWNCPVFLETPPSDTNPLGHTAKWEGRELWLDLSPGSIRYDIRRGGSMRQACSVPAQKQPMHKNDTLCCHYSLSLSDDAASFTLWRNLEDVDEILRRGLPLGITRGVGLYQEWKRFL